MSDYSNSDNVDYSNNDNCQKSPTAQRRWAMLQVAVSLLLVATSNAAAQASATAMADSIRVAIEAGVDNGDINAIESASALAERALAAHGGDALIQHYRAYALYRAGTMVLGTAEAGKARPYFDRARDILEPLAKQTGIPETQALLASVYGMQIATAKVPMWSGMRLGSKSNEAMEKAVNQGPNNPRVWLMRGIGAFNTPSSFGGGVDKAESYLKKAVELFGADAPAPPLPAWGRADAHIWLGQVYAKQKKVDSARAQYTAALALQPRNAWISQVLVPALNRLP
jgi:tetratricopeptide (TPR) repeat protein